MPQKHLFGDEIAFSVPLLAAAGDGVFIIQRPLQALCYLEVLLDGEPENHLLAEARDGLRLALATKEPVDIAAAREKTGWALLEAGVLMA